MALETDQPLFQWIVGGIATGGALAIGYLSRALTTFSDKTALDLNEVKKDYVRRDDLVVMLEGLRRDRAEAMKELDSLRTHVHSIANTIASLKGGRNSVGS